MSFTITKPPDPPKRVFALATAHHMFMKLHWELRGLKEQIDSQQSIGNQMVAGFFAFNAAVTAWHLTDWVWTSASKELKNEIASQFKFDDKKNESPLVKFQNVLVSNSRVLRMCRDIANGSKHMEENPKANTQASVDWKINSYTEGSVRIDYTSFDLRVSDENGELPLIEVLGEVIRFWQGCLSGWGFIGDQFIWGTEVNALDEGGEKV